MSPIPPRPVIAVAGRFFSCRANSLSLVTARDLHRTAIIEVARLKLGGCAAVPAMRQSRLCGSPGYAAVPAVRQSRLCGSLGCAAVSAVRQPAAHWKSVERMATMQLRNTRRA